MARNPAAPAFRELLEGPLDGATVKRMRAKVAAERAEIASATPLPLPDFEHALRIGRRLVESPLATWDALAPEQRPGFLRVGFPTRLEKAVVPPAGFEPAIFTLKG